MTNGDLNELGAALAKAQAAIQGARKDATNPHYRSKYADLASVWDACREPLTANGLSVIQLPGYNPEHRFAFLETILLHTSGQQIASVLNAPVPSDTPQGVGSALTYLRRYALMAMVGIAPEEDDGEAAERPEKADPKKKRQPDKPSAKQLKYVKDLLAADELSSDEVIQVEDWLETNPSAGKVSKAIDDLKERIEERKAEGAAETA